MPTIHTAQLTELRRIQLRSRRLVTGDILGQYRSAFRGSGLLFSDLREYQPGDDVKHIHWKATARSGRVFVKSYEEDRQLRIVLVVDTSSSMHATLGQQSSARAIEFCSLIGSLAQRGNDLLGLLLFAESPGEFLPPKSGPKRYARIVSSLLKADAQAGTTTDVAKALDYLSNANPKSSIVFIISDFDCADFTNALKIASRRHDVILVHLQPPANSLPSAGLVSFRDAETGRLCLVDTSSKVVRQSWEALLEGRRAALSKLAKQCGAEHIVVTDNCARPLIDLMQARVAKMSR